MKKGGGSDKVKKARFIPLEDESLPVAHSSVAPLLPAGSRASWKAYFSAASSCLSVCSQLRALSDIAAQRCWADQIRRLNDDLGIFLR